MKLERLRAVAVLLLLAGLAAALGLRAVQLVQAPDQLQGIDERKWFSFAWRGHGPAGAFDEVALPEDEEVWLTVPPDSDSLWWGLMARYHLPEQRVAGVLRRGERHPPPRGAWVVAVGPDGEVAVRRTRRAR